MESLKKCPSCGEGCFIESEIHSRNGMHARYFRVRCTELSCKRATNWYLIKENAIDDWNEGRSGTKMDRG